MQLLAVGIDTTVIALWLGHAGIEATSIYTHADLDIKERALARTTPSGTQARTLPRPRWPPRLPGDPLIMPSRSAKNPQHHKGSRRQLGIVRCSA